MAKVLIIDDDPGIGRVLTRMMETQGYHTQCALSLAQGLALVQAESFDVLFLDLMLPDGLGLDIMPSLLALTFPPEVIIITGHGDLKAAEKAFELGAWAYVAKPFSKEEILLPLKGALEYRQEKLATNVPRQILRGAIVGDSPQIMLSLDKVSQAAVSTANVLITGQTGTGKELFAKAIHDNSPRARGNFVVVDCTNLPEYLVQSLLFGHQRGAFTGADLPREGLIKQAHGGTLFLDEIGELPLRVQKSFLRVLQERKYLPLGATREQESDFRLVAATHQDLDQMCSTGLFRSDLLFRIRSITIHLPPLADRKQDIKLLVNHFLANFCERYAVDQKGYSPEFLSALMAYSWPGNVRELLNTVEGALAAAGSLHTLQPVHLPPAIRIASIPQAVPPPKSNDFDLSTADPFPTLGQYRQALEVKYLNALMARAVGAGKRAVELSGMSKSRLNALLKKYKISRPDRRRHS